MKINVTPNKKEKTFPSRDSTGMTSSWGIITSFFSSRGEETGNSIGGISGNWVGRE